MECSVLSCLVSSCLFSRIGEKLSYSDHHRLHGKHTVTAKPECRGHHTVRKIYCPLWTAAIQEVAGCGKGLVT